LLVSKALLHSTLSEHQRIIAIGDIHGCLFSLKKLIELVRPQPGEQLVFLGDLIDRGDHSKEVVDYLIELSFSYSCHFLMGNHELMFLDYLENRNSGEWLSNGGDATLKSYTTPAGFDVPQEHLEFFRSCKYFIETEHFFFTHGGLDPELSIKDNLRYYKPSDFCWQRMHMQLDFRETQRYRWRKTVVCAHTVVALPVLLDQLIAIDTGCVYNTNPLYGKLTAIVLPERRIVQTKNIE